MSIERLKGIANLAIISGSGMPKLLSNAKLIAIFQLSDIDSDINISAPSHKAELVVLRLNNCVFILIRGRIHYYEGLSSDSVCAVIKLLHKLGIKKIVLANAAGGLSEELKMGDIMLVDDHINFQFNNPLIGLGKNVDGTQFPDMLYSYDVDLRNDIALSAKNAGVILKRGVYFGLTGPSLETTAEYKMISRLGANAVGMSTVPEVIYANYLGMQCAAISVISNVFDSSCPKKHTLEDIVQEVQKSLFKLNDIFNKLIK
jgi:purine-nucleoside phosphorylase